MSLAVYAFKLQLSREFSPMVYMNPYARNLVHARYNTVLAKVNNY